MLTVAPSLPAYGHLTAEAVQCMADASVRYQVPELLMHAIVAKENGRVGQASRNKNGSYDLGPAQINTMWVPYFARFGVKLEHLLYNPCTNVQASAYILKDNANKFHGDWFKAIIAYNIGPNNWTPARYAIGYRYAMDVVKYWWGFQNWVDAYRKLQRLPIAMETPPQPVAATSALRRAGQQIVSRPPTLTIDSEQPPH